MLKKTAWAPVSCTACSSPLARSLEERTTRREPSAANWRCRSSTLCLVHQRLVRPGWNWPSSSGAQRKRGTCSSMRASWNGDTPSELAAAAFPCQKRRYCAQLTPLWTGAADRHSRHGPSPHFWPCLTTLRAADSAASSAGLSSTRRSRRNQNNAMSKRGGGWGCAMPTGALLPAARLSFLLFASGKTLKTVLISATGSGRQDDAGAHACPLSSGGVWWLWCGSLTPPPEHLCLKYRTQLIK